MTPIQVLPELTIAIPGVDCFYARQIQPKYIRVDLDGVACEYEPKRICIDLDGVVCEYDFARIVKGFFGVDISPTAIFAYDLADVLGVAPALINAMFREQIYGKPRITAGATETLRQWQSRGHELAIYSNRVKYMGERKLTQWLIDNGIPFSGIDIDGSMEYDVHIDDSPGKLMATNSRLKLLFTQPWNKRCLNIKGRLTIVNNWREVRDNVSALL